MPLNRQLLSSLRHVSVAEGTFHTSDAGFHEERPHMMLLFLCGDVDVPDNHAA